MRKYYHINLTDRTIQEEEQEGQALVKIERYLIAKFTAEDDDLPDFFYKEPLFPTNRVARFYGEDVHDIYDKLGVVE